MLHGKDVAFVSIHFEQEVGIVDAVHFEPGGVLFDGEKVFEFFEVVEVFYNVVVFLAIKDGLAREVALDHVLDAAVITQQSQLDDVVREFLPLHRAVTIHIDLFEQFDKCQGYLYVLLRVRPIEIQVFQHDTQKLLDSETLLLLLKAFLNDMHLLLVQHLQDVSFSQLLLELGFVRTILVHSAVAKLKYLIPSWTER